jgi:hypothetical protein
MDSTQLPRSLLDDIGIVPASLVYISWDMNFHPFTYRIESRDGKTVAIPTELLTAWTPMDLAADYI